MRRAEGGNDPVGEFWDALRTAGFRLPTTPIMDGEWHRAPVEGDKGRKQSGRYRGYLNGIRPAGFIKNFRDPTKTGPWKAGGTLPAMSAAEWAAVQREIAAAAAAKEGRAAARQDTIARRCTIAWAGSPKAPASHPYLLRKGIAAAGVRLDRRGRLRVPMYDFAGQLRCLQTIAPNRRKLFPRGSRLHGLHLLLGELRGDGPLLIAEGWATAQTLHEATGAAVAVAFNKSNFVAIALAYRERFPGLRVAFCGDNDHHHPRRDPPLPNVGKEAAEAAARETGGAVVLPHFEPHEAGSDWNDFATAHGLEAVRSTVLEQVQAASAPATPTPTPLQPHYPAPTSTREEALAALPREINAFFQDAERCAEVRRERLKAQEDHPPKSRERRAALRNVQRAMRAKYGAGWRAPGRQLLLPGAAGIGKTAKAAGAIAQRMTALGNVFYATDKTDNAEDVAALIPGAAVVRGRSRPDPKSLEGRTMCWRPEAAEAVVRAGLNVGTTLCDDGAGRVCPFKGRCGYQRDAALHRSGTVTVFAGSHEYLTKRGPMPSPDAVVIDESCVGALVGHLEFGMDRLLPETMEGWQIAGHAKAAAFRNIMGKVRDALPDPDGILAGLRKPERAFLKAEHFEPAIEYLRAVEGRDFTGRIAPDLDDEAVLEVLEQHQRSEIGSVLKLLTALQAEIHLPRDKAHGVVFHHDKPVKVDGRMERQDRIAVHYRKHLAFRADVPVLILDASGDVEIYRRLFGDRLEVATAVRCERNAEVVQVRDLTMARSSLTGTDRKGNPLSGTSVAKAARLRAEVVEVAEALAERDGGLALFTNKSVEALLAPDTGEAVTLGHFGFLRGKNDFENCATGMVLGRLQPPAQAMEDTARAIWSDDPEPLHLPGAYVKATRGIRMRDGSAVPVQVEVHPDPRVQRLLELHRERESEQGADRLRLIHNAEPKRLYIAGNVPLDMTVDRTVTWREFVHEATGRLDNRRQGKGRRIYGNRLAEAYRLCGGALPLSRSVLLRLFGPEGRIQPGLWGSGRAIGDDLGQAAVSAIRTLLAETAAYPPVLIRYRLKGQAGSECHALVGFPGEVGRAALEAVLERQVHEYGPLEGEPAAAEPAPAPSPAPAAPQPLQPETTMPEPPAPPLAASTPAAPDAAAPESDLHCQAAAQPPPAPAPEADQQPDAAQQVRLREELAHLAAQRARLRLVDARLKSVQPAPLTGDPTKDEIRLLVWRFDTARQRHHAERFPGAPPCGGSMAEGLGLLGAPG